MKHVSIPILDQPCEFINVTPVNPLISKCEIKVCYVSDEPNRNKSIITKEVAREMANSLPGSPIVGFYNETSGDFETHNRIIEISGGKLKFKETTRPYGFVDLGAKVWFQKFLDDGVNEREYLMTEGYLWTGQYPEAQRVIDKGNNQSMELDKNLLDASWTKDVNGNCKFFIINEAIISKLCILGENEEPCFEGASITQPTIEFSFDQDFKNQLFSMMNELKQLIKEGGTPMFTTYAVEIGDALWEALYGYLEANYPDDGGCGCSKYGIDSIWQEGSQLFAILRNREDGKLYRLNFSYSEDGFASDGTLVQVEKTYVPVIETPAFTQEQVQAYEDQRFAAKQDDTKEEEICPKCGKPISECTCEEEEDEEEEKKKYSLEEIPEYVELTNKYSNLEQDFNDLQEQYSNVKNQLQELIEFKASIDRQQKQAMIDSFYVLSDEDKKDVIDNIDTYSLDEIEAKLSIICVRNKVNFNLDDDNNHEPTTYTLTGGDSEDYIPAWIKSVKSVAKEKEI